MGPDNTNIYACGSTTVHGEKESSKLAATVGKSSLR